MAVRAEKERRWKNLNHVRSAEEKLNYQNLTMQIQTILCAVKNAVQAPELTKIVKRQLKRGIGG